MRRVRTLWAAAGFLAAAGTLAGCSGPDAARAQPQTTAAASSATALTQAPSSIDPSPAPSPLTSALVARLVEALPGEDGTAHALRVDLSCRELTSACADLSGLRVEAVSDDPSRPARIRIAVHPGSGPGSGPPGEEIFAAAEQRCVAGDYDHRPSLDPRGIGARPLDGERGTVTALTAQVPGWKTVSCLRQGTWYYARPVQESGAAMDVVDGHDFTEASTVALGIDERGEGVAVVVSASDPDLLASVRDAYFRRVGEPPAGG